MGVFTGMMDVRVCEREDSVRVHLVVGRHHGSVHRDDMSGRV